jgi:hypothetical protein
MYEDDMNLILTLISEEKINIDVCQIFNEASVLEILPKKSKSDSEIIFSKILRDRVDIAMKIWFDEEDERIYRGLEYEFRVYEYITKNIIQTNISPNFIPFIAFGKCFVKDIIIPLKEQSNNTFVMDLEKILLEEPDIQLNILVTARKQNLIPLKTFLEMIESVPTEELSSIVFQTLYSLLIMEKFKIVHNDFHSRNIMIQVLEKPICLSFEGLISFKTKYIIKIFDWDRSYVQDLGDNPMLYKSNSITIHQINKFRKNQDYYQFICLIKDNKQMVHIVNKILPNIENYKNWEYGNKKDLIKLFDKYENQFFEDYIINKKERVFKSLEAKHIIGVEIRKDKLKNFFNEQQIEIIKNEIGKEKFDNNYILYFIYSMNTKKLYMSKGWACQSLYDVDENVLYNLEDLFSNPILFSLLTLYLKKDCEEHYKISEFKIKENPVVLTDYTMKQYETYIDYDDE